MLVALLYERYPDLDVANDGRWGYRDLRNAYSDLNVSVDEVIAEGDTAMARGYIQGTHTGKSMNLRIPPTGKQMKVPYCSVTHWKNGKIVEEFTYAYLLLLVRQLGAMPAGSEETS